jgi:hypothetical protein
MIFVCYQQYAVFITSYMQFLGLDNQIQRQLKDFSCFDTFI